MGQIMSREDRERLSQQRSQSARERWEQHQNQQAAKRIRMHVSPWFRDEQGNPSRVVRCAE